MEAKKHYNVENRKDTCRLCGKPFTDEHPYFAVSFHGNCYQSNYGKIRRERGKIGRPKKKEYKLKKTIEPIVYKKRKFAHTDDRRKEEKWKIENESLLVSFKDNVKRRGGWIEWHEAYTLCHLFEIYYPDATTYLDTYPIEDQLIMMWDFIKDYEY